MFTIAPKFAAGDLEDLSLDLMIIIGKTLLKATLLVTTCFIFAKYFENKISHLMVRWDSSRKMLVGMTIGICVIISTISSELGFSVAAGAFFAGLAYSKDPNEHRIESGMEHIYQLFTPFFFVGIASSIDLNLISESLYFGIALLVAAVAGKILGVWLPSLVTKERKNGLLLGVSMIPRAEIALFIAATGVSMNSGALSASMYGAIVFVVLGSCTISPILMRILLTRSNLS